MSGSMCVTSLRHLQKGFFERSIIVKVDRIVTREVVRYPYGPDRPMKEQEDIHVVVFDESVSVGCDDFGFNIFCYFLFE